MSIMIFGPQARAEVRVDEEGRVQDIRISHPNRNNDIIIPPDWAADIGGSIADIVRDVRETLDGAQVTVVKLVPVER